jgi:hypothetical protein
MLSTLRDRIEDANEGINAGNSILGKLSDVLRMDWLRQLGAELKGLLYQSIAINIATYQAIVSNQTSLPSRLERGLIDDPVILEDAIGRMAPMHLQFITSWEAFNAILEIRFRGLQGHRKITKKQYELHDRATGRDIDQSQLWQRALLPGQRVEMSILFHDDIPPNSSSNSATCPGCHTSTTSSTDADVQCSNCFIWFRRITIVEETDPSGLTHSAQPRKPKPTMDQAGNSYSRKKPNGSSQPNEDEEEDIREFKRVRVMSTRRRKNGQQVDHTGQSNPGRYKFRLSSKSWADEDTTCFLVEIKGRTVARRADNRMINATKLLNVANMVRKERDDTLDSEGTRHVVKLAPFHMRGTWIPYDRALELANQMNITEQVYPLFVQNIEALLDSTSNQALVKNHDMFERFEELNLQTDATSGPDQVFQARNAETWESNLSPLDFRPPSHEGVGAIRTLRYDLINEEENLRYRQRKKRWSASVFKRSHSQSIEDESGSSDNDPLDDIDPHARRLRRRIRHHNSSALIFDA